MAIKDSEPEVLMALHCHGIGDAVAKWHHLAMFGFVNQVIRIAGGQGGHLLPKLA